MFINRFRLVFVVLLTLVISGCGFQLRGAIDISAEISPLYLQQNSVFELAREIKALLTTNNIEVVADPAQANSQLVLLNETKQSRVLSVDGNGRAREYSLTYTVNFTMTIKKAGEQAEGVGVVPKQETVSLTRSLIFDPEAVLAVTNETEILYREMRGNAARSILLKLQARSRKQSVPINGETADNSGTDKPR